MTLMLQDYPSIPEKCPNCATDLSQGGVVIARSDKATAKVIQLDGINYLSETSFYGKYEVKCGECGEKFCSGVVGVAGGGNF